MKGANWSRLNTVTVEQTILAEAKPAMARGMKAVQAEYMRRAARSRRTGHMLRTIVSDATRVGNIIYGWVGAGAFYARYLEEGTGLYGKRNRWITAKGGGMLRWPARGGATLAGRPRSGKPGQYIYARRVRGIRPRRFLRDAAMIAHPLVQRELQAGAVKAAHRLGLLAQRMGA